MIKRLSGWLLGTIAILAVGVIGTMAFMRRDHRVELVVTYRHSPPAAVWARLTDHASEPTWLPAFGTVTRQPDIGGRPVWTHTSADQAFAFTLMTVSAVPEQRYERILLRDRQPRSQSWDGRWVFALTPQGAGTVLRITEYGWTDGFPFFLQQRVLGSPDAFLTFYAQMLGRSLHDAADLQVVRSH
jgi:uncharacterized protein YndB with AHSA1/START domain